MSAAIPPQKAMSSVLASSFPAAPFPASTAPAVHGQAVAQELAWLQTLIHQRVAHFLEGKDTAFTLPELPALDPETALGARFLAVDASLEQRLVMALALAPHVSPGILDPLSVKNQTTDQPFSEFGMRRVGQGGARATVATALFLLVGSAVPARLALMALFAPDAPLRWHLGLQLGEAEGGSTLSEATLDLPSHEVWHLCQGHASSPAFSTQFPAKRLETALEWDDLVLSPETQHGLSHVLSWLQHSPQILQDWGLGRHFGQGYKCLFHGPPGTGKTLTASLLGKQVGLEVYRVDLSMIVSKYIGETEKNLSQVFDRAAEQEWVLFFDEADALFGERTATSSANDRFANQEVAYLLQRIEACQSLVILATNLPQNIDVAFFRRFQVSVRFARPDAAARAQLWAKVLAQMPIEPGVDLSDLAARFELSGAAIANAARHSAVLCLHSGQEQVGLVHLTHAIEHEMRKEGRRL